MLKEKMNGRFGELAREADAPAKDEVIHMRVSKKRKQELQKRARRAGISLSAYLLAAEDAFVHRG